MCPITPRAHPQRFIFLRVNDERWDAKRQERLAQRSLCWNAGTRKFSLKVKIQLVARKAGQHRSSPIKFNPEPHSRGKLVNRPASERIGGKDSHQARDQQCDHAECKWRSGIPCGALLHFAPEGRVAIARKYVASKLKQVRGSGELTAYVLEAMHALPEKQIGRRENRHAGIADAEPLRPIEE